MFPYHACHSVRVGILDFGDAIPGPHTEIGIVDRGQGRTQRSAVGTILRRRSVPNLRRLGRLVSRGRTLCARRIAPRLVAVE